MFRHLISVCALCVLSVAPVAASWSQAPAEDAVAPYTINPGDILSVTVWKEEDLQRQVLVRPDGSFSFPLAGDIDARNKSVEQVQAELVSRLERFIPDPVVTVATEQILGNKVYVLGQVNRPGEFIANTRMDVTQALAMAGGFTPFAQVNNVVILRRLGDEASSIGFKYGDIEKGKRLEQNILLQPGDTIVVP
jgi:polysaccharide export outer membrane protein